VGDIFRLYLDEPMTRCLRSQNSDRPSEKTRLPVSEDDGTHDSPSMDRAFPPQTGREDANGMSVVALVVKRLGGKSEETSYDSKKMGRNSCGKRVALGHGILDPHEICMLLGRLMESRDLQ